MVQHAGFYLLRCPYLPVNEMEKYASGDYSFEEFQEKIQLFFLQPDIEEAIYLASSELYDQLRKWISGEISSKKSINKLVFSLYKYLLRMCTRATPYGIFAGVATGRISDTCKIELGSNTMHSRKRRLDMSHIVGLSTILSQAQNIREKIRYYPNSSIYRVGDRFRYIEHITDKSSRKFSLVSVDSSVYLENAKKAARHGATIKELTDVIVGEEIEESDAREFIEDLIENQILVSELEPQVTGQSFLQIINRKLEQIDPVGEVYEKLKKIDEVINKEQFKISNYREINELLGTLGIQTNKEEIVQTDLHLEMNSNVLPDRLINELKDQVLKLWTLSGKYINPELDEFKREFQKRYEGQVLPLAQVLDPEFGIGYSSIGKEDVYTPLVGNAAFGGPDGWNEERTVRWNILADWKLRMYSEAITTGSYEVNISDEDLNNFSGRKDITMPESFYIKGSFLSKSASDLENGTYKFLLEGCGGPSGASLLARFSQNDPELTNDLKSLLDAEQRDLDNAIYAEIVHLPQPRVGNVLTRSILRDYELVYLANSAVGVNRQINVEDLLVTVKNDEVILYSKSLRKRILPRLTTAHNFHTGDLAIYKFWGDLQYQNLNNVVDWKWGVVEAHPFLPRVVYRNIILHRATWLIDAASLSISPNTRKVQELLFNEAPGMIKPIREKLKLPRYVVIAEGDNELFIDLENKFSLYLLVDTLVKKGKVTVREFLSTEGNCFVDGAAGKHAHQIIIPFKNNKTSKLVNNVPDLAAPAIKRTFNTGSEWLYVKIYAGANTIEDILRNELRLVMTNTAKAWKKWFFVRYADPDRHLRIRFFNDQDSDFWRYILEEIYDRFEPLVQNGIVWKIQTDTYQREIERYGNNAMELSESLFFIDSATVLDFLTLIEDAADEKLRWLFTLRGIDALLNDFDYNTDGKIKILEIMYSSFFAEFGSGKGLADSLNDKYRLYKKDIEMYFLSPQTNKDAVSISLLDHRSNRIKPVAKEIIHMMTAKHNSDTSALQAFLISHIHMFCNKVFSSRPRIQELFVYNFLYRYHISMKARAEK